MEMINKAEVKRAIAKRAPYGVSKLSAESGVSISVIAQLAAGSYNRNLKYLTAQKLIAAMRGRKAKKASPKSLATKKGLGKRKKKLK